MILATTKPDGKKVYFDARTGSPYQPGREKGRRLGHIPDDVIRFLAPRIEVKTPVIKPIVSRIMTAEKKKHDQLFRKVSFWQWLLQRLKSLLNGRK